MNNYGMTNWNDVEIKNNNSNRRDLFMKLDSGSNVMRIVTKPSEYLVHRYKSHESDPGYGERILSSLFHGKDPLVEKGLKPKRRWLVGVIDRKTQSYKVLDMSISVFKGIQELTRDEDWGDPSQFDIDVKVDKQGGPAGYYTIVPKNKKPLSASDLELREQADIEDLKKRCTPLTPEEVEEKVRAIDAKSPYLQSQNGSNNSDDEDDSDFPVQDGSDDI